MRTLPVTLGTNSTIVVILVAALTLCGCRPDVVPAEATEIASPLQLVAADETTEATPEPASGAGVATSLDEDVFGSFGLLAPAVPALVLSTYASSCDPFEDSFGSCL